MKIKRSSMGLLTALTICALLQAGCGSKSSTSTAGSTASSAAAAGPVAPLTGLPEADASIRNRPLLAIKIDNAPEARPQFGIQNADDIIEEKVEGGISRFMALFQSKDSTEVGPVRSLRSTDVHWLKPEGGMIAYSGGIPQFEALLAPAGITDVGADSHGSTYYKRRTDRPYEHSLYTNTTVLRTLTPKDETAAKPLFQYLTGKSKFGGAGVRPVTSVSLRMNAEPTATAFDWTWNAQTGLFMRGTDGKPHNIENAGQIAMKNVIVQFTNYSSTPYQDRADSPVDEADTTGSGDAWVLSDGKIVQGHWSRPSNDDITTYTDANGDPIKLSPGQTWVSLVPPGQFTQIRP
jgi:hypothetical protein